MSSVRLPRSAAVSQVEQGAALVDVGVGPGRVGRAAGRRPSAAPPAPARAPARRRRRGWSRGRRDRRRRRATVPRGCRGRPPSRPPRRPGPWPATGAGPGVAEVEERGALGDLAAEGGLRRLLRLRSRPRAGSGSASPRSKSDVPSGMVLPTAAVAAGSAFAASGWAAFCSSSTGVSNSEAPSPNREPPSLPSASWVPSTSDFASVAWGLPAWLPPAPRRRRTTSRRRRRTASRRSSRPPRARRRFARWLTGCRRGVGLARGGRRGRDRAPYRRRLRRRPSSGSPRRP